MISNTWLYAPYPKDTFLGVKYHLFLLVNKQFAKISNKGHFGHLKCREIRPATLPKGSSCLEVTIDNRFIKSLVDFHHRCYYYIRLAFNWKVKRSGNPFRCIRGPKSRRSYLTTSPRQNICFHTLGSRYLIIVTRLSDFWKFLATNFIWKVAQILGDFVGYFGK